MKNILLLFLCLFVAGLNAQVLEQRKSENTSIKILSVPIHPQSNAAPAVIDVIDRMALEKQIREDVRAEMAAACDERQLAIEKMKLEIECRGITPDELGIAPDTVCVGLGRYSEWVVRAISPNRVNGTYTALLDPATPLSSPGPTGTRRERAIVGFDEFVPVGTVLVMAIK